MRVPSDDSDSVSCFILHLPPPTSHSLDALTQPKNTNPTPTSYPLHCSEMDEAREAIDLLMAEMGDAKWAKSLKTLVEMGFEEAPAKQALEDTDGNERDALTKLIEQP